MTDAYEDLLMITDDQIVKEDSATNNGLCEEPNRGQKVIRGNAKQERSNTSSDTAEQRRKEFRCWLLSRGARHSSGGTHKAAERAAAEERRARRMERLQERLAAAEANRAASLARLQLRAAASSRRAEGAAERAAAAAAERTSAAAERLEADLAAAEGRRLALREAELERLRADHELVLSRLVSSQERAAAGAEQQRSRLEARLRIAASEREARLARRAARAASKVERARALSAQSREMQQQEMESKRLALEQKLETARRRREDRRLQPAGGAATAGSEVASASGTPAAAAADADGGAGATSTPSEPLSYSPTPLTSSQSPSPVRSPQRARPRGDAVATAEELSSAASPSEAGVSDGEGFADGGMPGPAAAGAEAAAAAAAEAAVISRLEGLRRSISSRRVQQVWRAFVQSKRTTRTLAEMFVAQGITRLRLPAPVAAHAAGAVDMPPPPRRRPAPPPVIIGALAGTGGSGDEGGGGGGDGFDRFASALRSPTTLRATQALMRRLEQRLAARTSVCTHTHGPSHGHGPGHGPAPSCSVGPPSPHSPPAASSVTRLLRRLYPTTTTTTTAARGVPLERYPPRVLLCAFMIVRHPEVVFSGAGAREAALAAAARDLVERLEVLLERIIVVQTEPPPPPSWEDSAAGAATSPPVAVSPVARGMEELLRRRRATAAAAAAGGGGGGGGGGGSRRLEPLASPSASSPYMSIGSLLLAFDDSWLRYLDQFVAWKGADAASLESELVRCAVALESSMLRKCRGDPHSERVRRSSDLQAVIAQVAHDQSLLRERVAKLGGEAGLARLRAALEAARRAVAAEVAERVAGGGSGWGSTSATASEADTEADAGSPARNTPRRRAGGFCGTSLPSPPRHPPGTATFAAAAAAAAAGSPAAAVLARQTPPPPLAVPLDVPPVAAPSPAAAAAAAAARPAASAPIPAPPRPGGGSSAAEVGTGAGACGGSDGGGGGAAGLAPSPLSASPRSPSSLRASLLGPDGGAAGRGAVHAPVLDATLVSNAAMVHEMLLGENTGSYRLPTLEAEAAWTRAVAAVSLDSGGLAVLHPAPLELAEGADLQSLSQEQLIRALRSRTAAIAECAFWDTVVVALAAALRTPTPTPAQAAAHVAHVAGGGVTRGSAAARLAAVMAPLLSEMALELAVVSNSAQQVSTLRAEFSEAAIRSQIESAAAAGSSTAAAAAAAAVQRALAVLERLATLLVGAGAPAREAAALEAHDTMRQRLIAALTEFVQQPPLPPPTPPAASATSDGSWSDDSEGDEDGRVPPPPLAAALGRSLRLLAAQVKLLKVDAANGRLQALAVSLRGDGGVSYLRSKFATIFRLDGPAAAAAAANSPVDAAATAAAVPPPPPTGSGTDRLLAALPRTSAWLRHSRAAAGGMTSYLSAHGVDLAAAVAAAAAAGGAPMHLRAGLRPLPGGGGGAWRWVVRCGLVGLVSSDVAAVGPALAETLLWDGERLHAAQNQFQQLVVVTAGLLLVSQLRATAAAVIRTAAGADPAAAAAAATVSAAGSWGPEARSAAARRLLVVVADPAMRLPYLTSELAAMAGVAGEEAAEARLRSAFMALVDPGSGAFRSITNALAAALLLHIALGPPSTAPEARGSPLAVGTSGGGAGGGVAAATAAALLGRVGATGLSADVAALGDQLLALAAVNEAVHAELYGKLYEHILQQQEAEPQVVAAGHTTVQPPSQPDGPDTAHGSEPSPAHGASSGKPSSQGGGGGGPVGKDQDNYDEEEADQQRLADGDEI